MSLIDLVDAINAKAYEPKAAYPIKPKHSCAFLKLARDLSDAELQSLPQQKRDYELALANYYIDQKSYQTEANRLLKQFYLDLCGGCDVPHDNEFIQKLYSLAWDRGHSNGLREVYDVFGNLLDLWELHMKIVLETEKRCKNK